LANWKTSAPQLQRGHLNSFAKAGHRATPPFSAASEGNPPAMLLGNLVTGKFAEAEQPAVV